MKIKMRTLEAVDWISLEMALRELAGSVRAYSNDSNLGDHFILGGVAGGSDPFRDPVKARIEIEVDLRLRGAR